MYINIEVFLGYGKYFSRTATLQQRNSNFQKQRKSSKSFVDRNENVVPLNRKT